jgi:hypothetical protein
MSSGVSEAVRPSSLLPLSERALTQPHPAPPAVCRLDGQTWTSQQGQSGDAQQLGAPVCTLLWSLFL